MIPNREGWNYIAVKKLSALLKGITSKNKRNFYSLTCLHSFRTKNKLESHKTLNETRDFCGVVRKLILLSFYHKRARRRIEFEEKVTCFGENTEKYITSPVPIEKKVKTTGKNGKEITKTNLIN